METTRSAGAVMATTELVRAFAQSVDLNISGGGAPRSKTQRVIEQVQASNAAQMRSASRSMLSSGTMTAVLKLQTHNA